MQRQGASLPFSFMRALLALLIAAAPAAAQPLPVVQLSAGMHLIRAALAAAAFSSGLTVTMPSTFFWLGQITNQTLAHMIVPSHAPMPIEVKGFFSMSACPR